MPDSYATKSDVEDIVNKAVDELSGVISAFANNVSVHFDGVSKQFDGVSKQFNRVHQQFEEARQERQDMRKDIKDIIGRMDHIEKQLEIDGDERLVLGHQLQKLHDWAVEAGDRIGIKFETH